jgi:RimJ/RimL family protein N-acetyltransferase
VQPDPWIYGGGGRSVDLVDGELPSQRSAVHLIQSTDRSSGLTGRWWTYIEDNGLLLRTLLPADAEGVLAVHGDPRVYTLDPHERHPDLAHSRRFITPMIEHWATHGFGYWTVLVPRTWWPAGDPGPEPRDGDRVHAGLGGIQNHAVAGEPVLNVYFRLAPSVQGRGIAGRILAECVRVAPHVALGIDLVVRTRPANAAARRVAVRGGFVDEGLEPGTTDMRLLRMRAPGPT